MNSVKAMELSDLIYKATRKHKIPANIYTAILMQESAYRLDAKNITCGYKADRAPASSMVWSGDSQEVCVISDFGIAQIHYKSVERYDFDAKRLMTDLEYSVNAGAEVLAWFHRTYSNREIDWWIRYNTGTRAKKKVISAWKAYKARVSRYL